MYPLKLGDLFPASGQHQHLLLARVAADIENGRSVGHLIHDLRSLADQCENIAATAQDADHEEFAPLTADISSDHGNAIVTIRSNTILISILNGLSAWLTKCLDLSHQQLFDTMRSNARADAPAILYSNITLSYLDTLSEQTAALKTSFENRQQLVDQLPEAMESLQNFQLLLTQLRKKMNDVFYHFLRQTFSHEYFRNITIGQQPAAAAPASKEIEDEKVGEEKSDVHD
jgi:hypothetical protein